MFFEVGDLLSQFGQLQMLDLLWVVADSHLVENNAEGPHIDSCSDPCIFMHLWSLVVDCTNKTFHLCLLLILIDQVAKAKVAYLGYWNFILLLFLGILSPLVLVISLDQNI